MRIRRTLVPALASLAVIAALASPAAAASHGSNRDSDRDGMPDRWEVAHQLNPKRAGDAKADPDHDGVSNLEEYRLNGDPRSADTDDDGVDDGTEATFHTKLNAADSDGDGIDDGDEDVNHDGICDRDQRHATGVIDDYDETTGDLTLTTRSGDSRTVTLTDDTEIDEREHEGWRHLPGGPVSDGHHHGDDADDGDDSGDPATSDDDWTETDAGDSQDDTGDVDVVDPANVDLLVDGTVVLKIKLASDGTVAELKLA